MPGTAQAAILKHLWKLPGESILPLFRKPCGIRRFMPSSGQSLPRGRDVTNQERRPAWCSFFDAFRVRENGWVGELSRVTMAIERTTQILERDDYPSTRIRTTFARTATGRRVVYHGAGRRSRGRGFSARREHFSRGASPAGSRGERTAGFTMARISRLTSRRSSRWHDRRRRDSRLEPCVGKQPNR